MHILLTDHLCCPRCGPEFGLILIANGIEERRVLKGVLGCPNCRDQYPIETGLADLRPQPREPVEPESHGSEPDELEVLRLAALLDLTEDPGLVGLFGPWGKHASGLSERVPGIQLVVSDPRESTSGEPMEVSRIRIGNVLPFFPASLRAAVVDAPQTSFLDEVLRALAPGGRLVIFDAGPELSRTIPERGLEVLLDEAGIVVATLRLPTRRR